VNGEKEFQRAMRMDKAIRERMPKDRRESPKMSAIHDTVKRTVDTLARQLDK